MKYNKNFLAIPDFIARYAKKLDEIPLEKQFDSSTLSLDLTILDLPSGSFKLLHPLFITGWNGYRMKYQNEPIQLVGLDIETEVTTGQPKLFGFYHNIYHFIYEPTLEKFFSFIKILESEKTHLVAWGNLDFQEIIRLFKPTEKERQLLSRGIIGKLYKHKGNWQPAIVREIDGQKFAVSMYLSHRALKLEWLGKTGFYSFIWIYNMSQFYQGTIAQTSKALNLLWTDFDKSTHIIDWDKFDSNTPYYKQVLASNEQDARIVKQLGMMLQDRFYETFKVYPSSLVSAGSIADASTQALISENEYKSLALNWIADNVWIHNSENKLIDKLNIYLSNAFSAGYVEQYGIGYLPEIHYADISAAYPDKIQKLWSLEDSYLVEGKNFSELDRNTVLYAVFSGHVTIPENLKYHPFTVKDSSRLNYRPLNTSFDCYYHLVEREWGLLRGITFQDEHFVAIISKKKSLSPLANVSLKLEAMRKDLLLAMTDTQNKDRYSYLDGQQYLVKVVNNSLYGKTVMTTEFIQTKNGKPVLMGYIAGDRFNNLYGGHITASTRVQLSEACYQISKNGGNPALLMTDSIYWQGTIKDLPSHFISWNEKKTGTFDIPKTYRDFYLIKSGQYEYYDSEKDKYYVKMRGLPIPRENLIESESYYHKNIQILAKKYPKFITNNEFIMEVPVRKLVTLGANDLDQLGAILDDYTQLKPFVLSGHRNGHTVPWKQCINKFYWIDEMTTQSIDLEYLNSEYETYKQEQIEALKISERNKKRAEISKARLRKQIWVYKECLKRNKELPPKGFERWTWIQIQEYFK